MKTAKASTANRNGNPPPWDKPLDLDPPLCFYEIEEGEKDEELEELEILVNNDSRLSASNQNLIKSKFQHINMFNHEGSDVIRIMRNLTVGYFEHL